MVYSMWQAIKIGEIQMGLIDGIKSTVWSIGQKLKETGDELTDWETRWCEYCKEYRKTTKHDGHRNCPYCGRTVT